MADFAAGLGPAIIALESQGYREAEIRRHSLDWLQQLVGRINEERRAQGEELGHLINRLQRSTLAGLGVMVHYAVAAVFNEEAGGKLEEELERLNSEEDDTWLTNPEAKGYNLDEFAAAGLNVQRTSMPQEEPT